MRFIKKFARFVGIIEYETGKQIIEYRCPNNKCSFHVSEEYSFCPYCGQKLKFKKSEELPNMVLFNKKPSKSILKEVLK